MLWLSAPLSSLFNRHSFNFLYGHIFASIYLLQQIEKRLILASFWIIYTCICIGDDTISCHRIASKVCCRWVWMRTMPSNCRWCLFELLFDSPPCRFHPASSSKLNAITAYIWVTLFCARDVTLLLVLHANQIILTRFTVFRKARSEQYGFQWISFKTGQSKVEKFA